MLDGAGASAARSVAAAALKDVPPVPARDSRGPSVMIEMLRQRHAAPSRGPRAGAAPVPQVQCGR
jgi:hypothetical protein